MCVCVFVCVRARTHTHTHTHTHIYIYIYTRLAVACTVYSDIQTLIIFIKACRPHGFSFSLSLSLHFFSISPALFLSSAIHSYQWLHLLRRLSTEQMNVGFCWSANTTVSMRRRPWEIDAYEMVLAFLEVTPCLNRLIYMVLLMSGKYTYSCCFVRYCFQDFFQNSAEYTDIVLIHILTVGLVVCQWPRKPGFGPRSSQRLKEWYLLPSCLTPSTMRYVLGVKWSNLGKGVASSSTNRCCSYWKGNLRVTLDFGHQLYIYIYIYIYTHSHTRIQRNFVSCRIKSCRKRTWRSSGIQFTGQSRLPKQTRWNKAENKWNSKRGHSVCLILFYICYVKVFFSTDGCLFSTEYFQSTWKKSQIFVCETKGK